MNICIRNPKVSVIMPVYNSARFLAEAIQSILQQSLEHFELIIINDGSSDQSKSIIEYYASLDSRIKVINRENRGLVYTLNEAVRFSQGEYIARMDADDVSLPNRLSEQVEFLDNNKYIDIVGCDYLCIDADGQVKTKATVPKTKDDIMLALCYTVPFAHPSILGRKEFFERHKYSESYVEDYKLWVVGFNGNNYANLDSVLFCYRHNYGSSFSDKKRVKMMEEEFEISESHMRKSMDNIRSIIYSKKSGSKYVGNVLVRLLFLKKYKSLISLISIKGAYFLFFGYYLIRHLLRRIYWISK